MHIGLIGGIGPAATEFYYRGLTDRHAKSGTRLDLMIANAEVHWLAWPTGNGLATSWGSLGAKDNRDHDKLEVAVPANLAQRAVETICDAARTGNIGGGKIFVLALESSQRVRTGETGESAL